AEWEIRLAAQVHPAVTRGTARVHEELEALLLLLSQRFIVSPQEAVERRIGRDQRGFERRQRTRRVVEAHGVRSAECLLECFDIRRNALQSRFDPLRRLNRAFARSRNAVSVCAEFAHASNPAPMTTDESNACGVICSPSNADSVASRTSEGHPAFVLHLCPCALPAGHARNGPARS